MRMLRRVSFRACVWMEACSLSGGCSDSREWMAGCQWSGTWGLLSWGSCGARPWSRRAHCIRETREGHGGWRKSLRGGSRGLVARGGSHGLCYRFGYLLHSSLILWFLFHVHPLIFPQNSQHICSMHHCHVGFLFSWLCFISIDHKLL